MFSSFKNLSIFSSNVTPVNNNNSNSDQQQQQDTNESETIDNNNSSNNQNKSKIANAVSGDTFKMIGSKFSMWTTNVIHKIDEERKKLMEETEDSEKVNRVLNERLPPWMDFKLDDKERHKEAVDKILDVKMSKKTFLQSPPIDSDYCQEFDSFLVQIATASLKYDKQLEKIRFLMVPRYISEEQFWKNWYYRVTLVRKEFNIIDGLNDRVAKSSVIKDNSDVDIATSTTTTTLSTTSSFDKISISSQHENDISNWEKELLSELDGYTDENLIVDLSMNNDLIEGIQDNNISNNNNNSDDHQQQNEGEEENENKGGDNVNIIKNNEEDIDSIIDEELKREAELLKMSPPALDSDDDLMKEIEAEIS